MFKGLSFSAEPAAWAEFFRLGFIFAALMGWVHLDEGQKLALFAFVSFGLTTLVRSRVTSQETLKQAGLSQAIVLDRAADPKIRPLDSKDA
jgi:hypothetical protein